MFAPEEIEDIAIDTARVSLAKTSSSQLDMIFDDIVADYVKLRADVKSGSFSSVYARQLKSVMSQLSVDEDLVYQDSSRIALPIQAMKKILPLLHVSLIGMNKTNDLCHKTFGRECLMTLSKWFLSVALVTFIVCHSPRIPGLLNRLLLSWVNQWVIWD